MEMLGVQSPLQELSERLPRNLHAGGRRGGNDRGVALLVFDQPCLPEEVPGEKREHLVPPHDHCYLSLHHHKHRHRILSCSHHLLPLGKVQQQRLIPQPLPLLRLQPREDGDGRKQLPERQGALLHDRVEVALKLLTLLLEAAFEILLVLLLSCVSIAALLIVCTNRAWAASLDTWNFELQLHHVGKFLQVDATISVRVIFFQNYVQFVIGESFPHHCKSLLDLASLQCSAMIFVKLSESFFDAYVQLMRGQVGKPSGQ
mmetsp:Transcript_2798/g.6708  ORF Transcript_2798/g.6708 Transcript_2798/m.6708 type:complete len:259 (-) Transcript_2798:162-938(-)